MDKNWVLSSPLDPLPQFALVGGHNCNGNPIYVGCAFHGGENLPAKVIPAKACAYISYEGAEYSKTRYYVFVGRDYDWIHCHSGIIPPNAVSCGATASGETLFVGRGYYGKSLTVGKILHGSLHIPFNGREIKLSSFEVLVPQSSMQPSIPKKILTFLDDVYEGPGESVCSYANIAKDYFTHK